MESFSKSRRKKRFNNNYIHLFNLNCNLEIQKEINIIKNKEYEISAKNKTTIKEKNTKNLDKSFDFFIKTKNFSKNKEKTYNYKIENNLMNEKESNNNISDNLNNNKNKINNTFDNLNSSHLKNEINEDFSMFMDPNYEDDLTL